MKQFAVIAYKQDNTYDFSFRGISGGAYRAYTSPQKEATRPDALADEAAVYFTDDETSAINLANLLSSKHSGVMYMVAATSHTFTSSPSKPTRGIMSAKGHMPA